MNPYNPYQAPQMNDGGMGAGPSDGTQAAILESMKRTRPWVMFLSILGFLAAGFMFLAGLIAMASSAASSAFMKGPMAALGPALGFIYFLLGAFYVVPSILLWQYASSIAQYSLSGGAMDSLANAVKKQSSFWRFVGISTAVLMGLYFVGIVIAVIVGVGSAMSR